MPKSNGPKQGTRNKLQNDPRERGISPPQRSIAEFEEGEIVHLRLDPSIPDGQFHPRFNGLTGEVVGMQGSAYKVEVEDGNAEKTVLANPAHLVSQE
ncbi:50S ribosomal protein L21e [Salinarchaeum sp. IM2453]|uniref:50S ribosomal protein L21e n=1 Tax=Salinarchaeum sp. IM2453 TaxID=2862870 RepID=UPI001C834CE4|nr:50S ribosomal protein L21e [Salinarchaeum sp. IM2453]QZA88869.1 50S ribosomal protein L21e [Salinarchaeum sp. IM2453]